MTWAIGLMIVCGSLVAIYIFAECADRFGPDDDWDSVADQKRRNGRSARKLSGEFQDQRL